jgi:hypothetical protein
MLSSDFALFQHVPGDRLTQEKHCLCVHSKAAIKAFAGDVQQITAFSDTDTGIVHETINPSPAPRCRLDKLCVLVEVGDVATEKNTLGA